MKAYADNRAIDYQAVPAISIAPFKILITLAVILFFTLILIWSRINFIAASYRMSALALQTQNLTEQIDKYNLEIATLKSRSRIETIAKTRLNMVYPDSKQLLSIDR